jgi:small subunit ribosomal protein S16
MGSINKPFYRVIAIDSRARRDGRYIENIGFYDPKQNPAIVELDAEKAIKWLQAGAQPTETVRSLFRKTGILKKWHEIKYVKRNEEATSETDETIEPSVMKVKKPKEKKVVIQTEAVVEQTTEEINVQSDIEPTIDEAALEETVSDTDTPDTVIESKDDDEKNE